jgi:NAD(P)-dependent dehydrogenase (short-subunit alcohol dehydrogenase family)
MAIRGSVALVTGGARGIGAAICERLGAEGARVAVNYRQDRDAALATLERVRAAGGDGIVVAGDVGDVESLTRVIATARSELGPIGLLVNNAAYTRLLSVDELTLDRWQRLFRTNVEAAYLATWAVKDDMAALGGGAVVNISSLDGARPRAESLAYGASKAALNHFTKGAALALAGHGIRVNAVAPGLVWTDRAHQTIPPERREAMTSGIPMKRGAQPAEIADVVHFLLSDQASYITGEVVTVAGGR